MLPIQEIVEKENLTKEDIVTLLTVKTKEEQDVLLQKANAVKEQFVGKKVYLRGLIELSNICGKNCFYCGIRAENNNTKRYNIPDEEVVEVIRFAKSNQFSSVVIQSGELCNFAFTKRITRLLEKIQNISEQFRVTLSLGEQSEETYREWYNAGAQRYLLRIESSDRELYRTLHPNNKLHDYEARLKCLQVLKRIGYQAGTGVMIGLPFQTFENLADDLLFMKNLDIDMVGMGPYIEHEDTPLYQYRESLLPIKDRFDLSLRMIAILRILMKDINIASTTALQSIDPEGREKGLLAGANVLMPNLTPLKYRDNYMLYENKPGVFQDEEESVVYIKKVVNSAGEEIAQDYGDSLHFKKKRQF